MLEKQIADKIRKIRRSKGYTLEQLGRLTDLSKGLLSRIENYQVCPPIATLSKISHGLEVPIGIFFYPEVTNDKEGYTVTLKNERKKINRRRFLGGMDYYSLSGMGSDNLIESFIVTYSADDKKPEKLYDHPGEEFLMVLKGRVDFMYGEKTIRLATGDAIHFDPSNPHQVMSVGKTESECLVIIIDKRK